MSLLLTLASLAAAQDTDLLVTGPLTVTEGGTYDHIVVLDGGELIIDAGAPITLEATSVFVADGGVITATGTGYQGVDDDAGLGPAGGAAGGGGGGHVGSGEPNWEGGCLPGSDGGLGATPIDLLDPDMGSAGGGDGGVGSAGGGALTLRADDIEIYGRVEADGADASPTGGAGGGGAVVLLADRLVCTGTLSARGGDGEYYGPGGGGLVVQRYDSFGLACAVDVAGGPELECSGPDAGDGLNDVAPFDYDGDAAIDDCDPRDAAVPGAEVCNGLDDDCDGVIDDGVACGSCTAHHPGDATYQHCTTPVAQADAFTTCADLDPDRYEVVTLSDEAEWVDVQGITTSTWTGLQEESTYQWRWASGEDSWFFPWVQASCGAGSQPDNSATCAAMVDTLGFGCAGYLDDRTCTDLLPVVCEACDWQTFYVDLDGDGFGDVTQPIEACRPEGLGQVATVAGDCDDLLATVHPAAPEVCDGIDNDCDGHIDPAGLSFTDADFDGFGDPAAPLIAETCAALPGAPNDAADATDCDDVLFAIRPDAAEQCNGVDDDCDGLIDEDGACPSCDHVDLDDTDYQVCTTAVPYSVAESLCSAYGAALASLATVEENQRLSSALVDSGIERMWMGLSFDGYTWSWDDGTPFDLALWDDYEPSGDGTHGELWNATDQPRFGTWNDAPDVTPLGFLCELPCEAEPLYADADGDGFGAGPLTYACAGDGWSANDADCDDADPTVHPGSFDHPGDDVDQDCTGQLRCYVDDDGDGFGTDIQVTAASCDDAGVAPVAGDCDDTDLAIYPGAPEVVGDDVDQDCDQRDRCYVDGDGDGFGTSATVPGATDRCIAEGEATEAGDCDDADPAVHPDADEVLADGLDNDCDGFDTCYDDADADGWGTSDVVDAAPDPYAPCSEADRAAVDGDCAPFDANISPGATEIVASGADEDCDARELCYIDDDGDTYGDGTESTVDIACDDPGHTTLDGDCNDQDGGIFPGAMELPADGVDQDCTNTELCYSDSDRDGVVAPASETIDHPSLACTGSGVSPTPGDDCDDTDADTYPGAPEVVADGIDQDCDTLDGCWPDGDGDGYGTDDAGTPVAAASCTDKGVSPTGDDCNDADAAIHPGATEIPDGGTDQNCDGFELCATDEDADGFDGVRDAVLGGCAVPKTELDCDDDDDSIFPGAPEVPVDGIDQDCDELEACWIDDDGDTFGDDQATPVDGSLTDAKTFCTEDGVSATGGDCDDDAFYVNPGVPELLCDNVDNDCNPKTRDCPSGVETGPTGLPTVLTGDTSPTADTVDTSGPTVDTATTVDPFPTTTTPTDGDDPGAAAGGCACQQSRAPAGSLGGIGLALALGWRRRRR